MKTAKISLILVSCFALSTLAVMSVSIPSTGIGGELRRTWESSRGGVSIESPSAVYEGAVSLGLFLLLITLTALDMRYRHFLAILAVSAVVFLGVAPPQKLVGSVDWALIVFLVGSMSFATILRKIGVFTYLAAHIVKFSRGRPLPLLALLSALAWFAAMVVDEVTSIVYVIMVVLELSRLLKVDPEELAILVVLTTNVGSLALPVGNPIGVYIAFTTGFTPRDFILSALPLSALCFLATVLLFSLIRARYVRELALATASRSEMLEAFITTKLVDIEPRERRARTYGVALLLAFLVTVSITPLIAELLTFLSGFYIDPNSLLALVPCLFVALTLPVMEVPELGEVLAKGVEWPSIAFFMFLFMLGYSLTWSGAMVKIAYSIVSISQLINPSALSLFDMLMVASAVLSAFLDNLSLVVALVPAIELIVRIAGFRELFWSILFGGVLGGNLTPVGSTANIVAVSILERRRRVKISWARWMKISLPIVVAQLVLASTWSLLLL
ncbi:MAG: SLC13 family permease [Sulfolobales archaeon]|nr:SLC13 family permease [Sulfolobales archaeon]MCX8209010.1 SLC13 family permease [Sulfolobales archaeon]MDW8010018.1 SLC13 family permease [Sulfolobales archaeon]